MRHDVLQTAFGWHNSHLHDFQVGDIRFGMADVEGEMFCVDERAAPVGAVACAGFKLVYRYDFGKDWSTRSPLARGVDRALHPRRARLPSRGLR